LISLQVGLRTSFDDWEPEAMEPSDGSDRAFTLHRLVPPGTSYYYFVVDGRQAIPKAGSASLTLTSFQRRYDAHCRPDIPQDLHMIEVVPPAATGKPLRVHKAKPRHRRLLEKEEMEEEVEAWKFENSIFAAFKSDHQALLHQCFESDYNQTRLETKLGKYPDDLAVAKTLLEENYALLKNIFKHYAAAYASSDGIYNISGGEW